MITAVYAGSFDPPTLGHLDLIERAVPLVDKLIVSIGVHPTRTPLFSAEERLEMLRDWTAKFPAVEVCTYRGLLVDHCLAVGARLILRGLRNSVDFEYELPIAQANQAMVPGIETLFFAPRPEHSFVSASLVREIAGHGGDLSRFVPPSIEAILCRKFGKNKPGT